MYVMLLIMMMMTILTRVHCEFQDPPCAFIGQHENYYNVRNDTCSHCSYDTSFQDCIDCHGGSVYIPTGRAGPHYCMCPAHTRGLDCRDCVEGGCPGGGTCEHTTNIRAYGEMIFTCDVTGMLSEIFHGTLVWQTYWDPFKPGSKGTTSMIGYGNKDRSPVAFTCETSGCTLGFDGANQKMVCEQSHCAATGFLSSQAAAIMEQIHGEATFLMDANGVGSLRSSHLFMAISYTCTATSCRAPGESGSPITPTAQAFVIVGGIAVGVVVMLALIGIFVRYRLLKQRFIVYGDQRTPCTLAWDNVWCTLPRVKRRRRQPQTAVPAAAAADFHVLRGVTGSALPGQLLAVLGESGAGKTSLLDALAGHKTFGRLHGTITLNGAPATREWRRISAYVMQDDVFVSTMSVEEHLLFVARMRLPAVMSGAQREQLVDQVLQRVGLSHVRKTTIGDHAHKGLSGGERKRLNIATELLTEPEIIFLDEPTSGLDAANARRIVQLLSDLAREENRTIVMTIHQPASALYSMFDAVACMAMGYCVFHTDREEVLPFLESRGYVLPANYNPADFIIECVTGLQTEAEVREFSMPGRQRTPLPAGNDVMQTGAASRLTPHQITAKLPPPETVVVEDSDGESREALILAHPSSASFSTQSHHARIAAQQQQQQQRMNAEDATHRLLYGAPVAPPLDVMKRPVLGEYPQPFLMQTVYLMHRNLVNIWRNPYLLRLQYLLMICISVVLGVVYFRMTLNYPDGAQNRLGVMFFLTLLLTVTSLASMDTFFADRNIFVRQHSLGFYSAGSYFVAKVIADVLPLRILPTVLLTSVLYPMAQLHAGAEHVLYFVLLLMLISYCSTGLCMCISAFTPSVSVGNLVAIVIMLFSMLFGGLLIHRGSIPQFLTWLRYLSFVNFGFEALMVNELVDLDLIIPAPPGSGGHNTPVTGTFSLQEFGLDPANFYMDIYLLLILGTLFFIAAFIRLSTLKEKR